VEFTLQFWLYIYIYIFMLYFEYIWKSKITKCYLTQRIELPLTSLTCDHNDLKIYRSQNNFVEPLKQLYIGFSTSNAIKDFDILATSLNDLHNYFDNIF